MNRKHKLTALSAVVTLLMITGVTLASPTVNTLSEAQKHQVEKLIELGEIDKDLLIKMPGFIIYEDGSIDFMKNGPHTLEDALQEVREQKAIADAKKAKEKKKKSKAKSNESSTVDTDTDVSHDSNDVAHNDKRQAERDNAEELSQRSDSFSTGKYVPKTEENVSDGHGNSVGPSSTSSTESENDRVDRIIMETFNSMPSVLTQYVNSIQRTYEPLWSNPNAIAWALGGDIKYYMNAMEETATIYHEVAHAWDWGTKLSYTTAMYDIYHEEWVGTGVYGATNVQEAVAETVAHIYTGYPIPHAPKTVAITRQWLGLDPWSVEYAHYADLANGNDTIWNAENNNTYDRVFDKDTLVYTDYYGTEYGIVKAGTTYRKIYETIGYDGSYRHLLQIDNGDTVIAIY